MVEKSNSALSDLPADTPAPLPEIAVVMLTNGCRRQSMRRALESVAAQTYRGSLVLLVVCDGIAAPTSELGGLARAAGLRCETVTFTLDYPFQSPTIARVAHLRDLALSLVQSPRMCFLDDDNYWEPEHLAQLSDHLDTSQVLGAYSWRRLVDRRGQPFCPDRFPWLPDQPEERQIYALYVNHGVLDSESPVVRDQANLLVDGVEYGMVDLGAWLFDTQMLRHIGFVKEYSPAEVARRVGEDDKLLARLRELGIPTVCSQAATLIYTLGGFSNRRVDDGDNHWIE